MQGFKFERHAALGSALQQESIDYVATLSSSRPGGTNGQPSYWCRPATG